MNIPKDPNMLLSWVNMKLRDDYAHLDRLCDDMQLDRSELTQTLLQIGYTYQPHINQFRPSHH